MPPLLLPPDLRLSPEQFAQVCDANPEAVLELTADGQLIAMAPTGGDTGARNSLLITQLQIWVRRLPLSRRLSAQPGCIRRAAGALASPSDEGPRGLQPFAARWPPTWAAAKPG